MRASGQEVDGRDAKQRLARRPDANPCRSCDASLVSVTVDSTFCSRMFQLAIYDPRVDWPAAAKPGQTFHSARATAVFCAGFHGFEARTTKQSKAKQMGDGENKHSDGKQNLGK